MARQSKNISLPKDLADFFASKFPGDASGIMTGLGYAFKYEMEAGDESIFLYTKKNDPDNPMIRIIKGTRKRS